MNISWLFLIVVQVLPTDLSIKFPIANKSELEWPVYLELIPSQWELENSGHLAKA